MGCLDREPVSGLVRDLQAALQLRHFVETGTYKGDGSAFAATLFETVDTIELRPDFYEDARTRLSPLGVRQFRGDSRTVLPSVVNELAGSALFWLDGHSGGGYFADHDDCPLIEELSAIAASPFEHAILVDDARAFVAPPPPPFNADKWPTLIEVMDAARQRFAYECVIISDIIVFTPLRCRQVVTAYCRRARPKI